jgi:hypothetical protein
LVEGGLLILYLTNYKFSDTTIYKNYEIIHDNSIIEERVPIFNKSGQKIQNEHYDDVIFKKITHHKFDFSN